MYYTTEAYFRQRFNEMSRPFSFAARTPKEYQAWKQEFRTALSRLLGLDKMQPCALKPVRLETEKMDGYTRDKIIICTEPGIEMPFYALKPDSAGKHGRWPVVVAPHGHGSNGKSAVCGADSGHPEIQATIAEHNYDYGVQLVKAGFLVLCPDARGFGERAEKYEQSADRLLGSSCAYLNAMAYPLGLCVAGMWTWDLMRLVDYALTRKDADPARIGCAGLSGGGMQTLWLGAMDERVRGAIISGYFYGSRQALLEMHNCSCNYVPGLWENADMGDIAALMANRAVFIETGDADPLNGTDGLENVYPQLATLKKAAAVLGNENRIRHGIFAGHHKWWGKESIPWMADMLKGEDDYDL